MSDRLKIIRRILVTPPVIVYITCLLLIAFNLIMAYKLRPFSSDDVFWQAILQSWRPFSNETVTLGNSSVYVDKIPFYVVLDHFFEPGRKTLFIQAALSTIAGFTAFYGACIYFLKKMRVTLNYMNLAPFVWLSSFGYYFIQLYLNPNWRGFQLGISFVVFALVAAIYADDIKLRSTASKLWLILAAAFIGLQAYSDPYLIYFTIGPLFLLSGILFVLKLVNARHLIIVAGTGILSLGFAKVIGLIAANSGVQTAITYPMQFVDFDKVAGAFGISIHSMLIILGADFWGLDIASVAAITALLNFAIVALIIYRCLVALVKNLKGKDAFNKIWLLFFAAVSLLVFTLYTISTMAVGIATYRYFLLLVLIFVLLLAVLIGSTKNLRLKGAILTIVAIASLSNLGLTAIKSHNVQAGILDNKANSLNLAIVNELEGSDYTKGYANYWHGPINTYLSGGNVNFLPIVCANKQTIKFHWLVNDASFNRPAAKSFYIVDPDIKEPATCKTPELRKQFGEPREIVKIGNASIFKYDYDIGSKMK